MKKKKLKSKHIVVRQPLTKTIESTIKHQQVQLMLLNAIYPNWQDLLNKKEKA